MTKTNQKPPSLDEPAFYRIKVGGRLNESWLETFEGMTIKVERTASCCAATTLEGIVADQSKLHGLLKQIRDLGLPLLLVELVEKEEKGG